MKKTSSSNNPPMLQVKPATAASANKKTSAASPKSGARKQTGAPAATAKPLKTTARANSRRSASATTVVNLTAPTAAPVPPVAPATAAPAPAPIRLKNNRKRRTMKPAAQPAAVTPRTSLLKSVGSMFQGLSMPRLGTPASWALTALLLVVVIWFSKSLFTSDKTASDDGATDSSVVRIPKTNDVSVVSITASTTNSSVETTAQTVVSAKIPVAVQNTAVGKVGGTNNTVNVLQYNINYPGFTDSSKGIRLPAPKWPLNCAADHTEDLAPNEALDYDEIIYRIPPQKDWQFNIPAGWNAQGVTKMPASLFNKAEGGECTDDKAGTQELKVTNHRIRNNSPDREMVVGFKCSRRAIAFQGFSQL